MDTLAVIDFGSQYTQLIARRLREMEVYAEVYAYNAPDFLMENVKGVIFSGGPASVSDAGAPDINLERFMGKVPVLGVCYGAQLLAARLGGKVTPASHREYGAARLHFIEPSELWRNYKENTVWMSHGDTITQLPLGFRHVGRTDSVLYAAFEAPDLSVYGLQFHPEVSHTEGGKQILHNFAFEICRVKPEWTAGAFIESTVENIRRAVGDGWAICALSGGVDSTVAAALARRAIGDRLRCIFVNNGLLRKGEFEEVLAAYREMDLPCEGVDAADTFLSALSGVADPEEKRKIIGRVFIEVFEKEALKYANVEYLVQGTIYPDVIESVSVLGPSAKIKSHHNVGGLPQKMNLKLVEPLRPLFKDEVRRVGAGLGTPPVILARHPFPGPGLAIRVLGEVTAARVEILQAADKIFIDSLKEFKLYDTIWQAFAVLLPVSSVGVMGDERSYENVLALRAVTSLDGMTADWARLPHDFLAEVSNRIINAVRGVNRVVYDISSKPPATIEWE